MKKGTIIIVVLLFVAAICCGGGYLAYQKVKSSGLGNLFGTNSQSLGINYTEADALNFQTKIGTSAQSITTTDSPCTGNVTCVSGLPTYVGTKKINTTLTNEEGTALINEWIKLSPNAPFSSAQMRVNKDGSVDFVGVVDMTRAKSFAKVSGVPQDTVAMVSKYVGILGNSFPITASGRLTIKNNVVDANFSSMKVGIIQVPQNIFTENKSTIDTFVSDRFKIVKGMSIEELSFADGKTTFKGTMPERIYFVR